MEGAGAAARRAGRYEVAGRTDAGVHAPGRWWLRRAARTSQEAYSGAHGSASPRYRGRGRGRGARRVRPAARSHGKRYRYRICNRPVALAAAPRTHWELFAPLDVEAMRRGAVHLLGRHDFSAFRAANCEAADDVRDVRRVDVLGTSRDESSSLRRGHRLPQAHGAQPRRHPGGGGRGAVPTPGWRRCSPRATASEPVLPPPPHGLVLVEVRYQ